VLTVRVDGQAPFHEVHEADAKASYVARVSNVPVWDDAAGRETNLIGWRWRLEWGLMARVPKGRFADDFHLCVVGAPE
jgi:hypothetical protein